MSNTTIILKGRLGRDAELKATANGTEFISFSMAVDELENREKKTYWYSVTSYQPNHITAMRQYLTKGKPIEVIGTLKPGTYTDKTGVERMDLNVRAGIINFIDFGKKDEDGTQQAPAQAAAPVAAPVQATPVATEAPAPTFQQPAYAPAAKGPDPEDDLPF